VTAPGLLITMQRWTGETLPTERPVRYLTRHDTHICPRARFLDEVGDALDLTDCTVTYTLKNRQTGTLKLTLAPADMEDQLTNAAEVFYQPEAIDVDTAGNYAEEWEITYLDSTKETFPSDGKPQLVKITEDLGNS
jgi:hypothetical protein